MPNRDVAAAAGERRIKREHPRRDEILEQAETLIREHRLHNVTLRGLARSMSLSATALYEYFFDKQELLAALYERAANRLLESLVRSDDPTLDVDARVRIIGRDYFRFGVEEAGLYLFLFDRPWEDFGPWVQSTAGTPEEELQEHRPAFAFIVALLESEKDSFRADFRAVNAAVELWALVYGFVALTLNHQFPAGIDGEALVERAVNHLLAGWRRPWE
jgi:AcrR family transcriptional regulator